MSWLVAVPEGGDYFDGGIYALVGPFETEEAADAWAESSAVASNFRDWQRLQVTGPDSFEPQIGES